MPWGIPYILVGTGAEGRGMHRVGKSDTEAEECHRAAHRGMQSFTEGNAVGSMEWCVEGQNDDLTQWSWPGEPNI